MNRRKKAEDELAVLAVRIFNDGYDRAQKEYSARAAELVEAGSMGIPPSHIAKVKKLTGYHEQT